MTLTIAQEDPSAPDVLVLLRNAAASSARLYPQKSEGELQLEALRAHDVRFLVARDAGNRALAAGALVVHGDWAEIKRVWVEQEARGCGESKQMLGALIVIARQDGVRILRLEAGSLGFVALSLYKSAGFRQPRSRSPEHVLGETSLTMPAPQTHQSRSRSPSDYRLICARPRLAIMTTVLLDRSILQAAPLSHAIEGAPWLARRA
jgi:putative acetyltransferase